MTKRKADLPTPLPAAELVRESPVVLARKIVDGGAFTDADAIRVADAYLWLIDDGADAA